MAVTFHNFTQTAGPASVGTKTVVHTISAADATLLVFTQANTAISISAMAANGLSLTRLGHISASSSRAEVWGLSAGIPIATLSISANVVGAASLDFCLAVVSYIGARQIGGSPFGTVVAGSAQGVANVAFSVSSTSTDLVAYGFGVSGAPAVTITTGTNRGSSTATTAARLVIGDVAGSATVSISATAATSNTWSFLAVPIVASAAAATTTLKFDNANATATTTVVNSIGILLTATANACLLVLTDVGGGSQTLSSVVIGSTNLTFLAGVDFSSNTRRIEAWVLTAPATGILTISAIIAAGGTTNMGIGAITYTGHKTPNPFGGVATASVASTTRAELSVSSTAGNIVVLFAAPDNNAAAPSAGPAMVLRANSTDFPAIYIADVPAVGAANTAIAVGSLATTWGVIGINLIQAGFISGAAAAITDVRDKFSASGQVIVVGRLSATDILDKFSASGQVIVSGRLSATDVHDKFSASGQVIVSGRMSATDVMGTFSASGYTLVTSRLSATDARDVFSASGQIIVTARLSATDVLDHFSASGQLVISARLSATDTTDRFSASGQVIVQGLLAATDTRDIFSASGVLVAVGNVNATGAFTDHPDTFVSTGITSAPAAVVTTIQQDAGSGGGHGKQQREYFRADPAFWSLREQYLRRIHKDISAEPEIILMEVPVTASIAAAPPTPIDPGPLAALRASRARTVEAIPAATNMRQLRYHGARLATINARIAEQKRLIAIAEQQARIAARAARKILRARTIRRAKRRITMLAATRAVAALSYIISNPTPNL